MVIKSQYKVSVLIWLASICLLVAGTVVVGGATRLTESGLSITEWKPIIGSIPPLNAEQWEEAFELYKQIPQYKIMNKKMDLEGFKFIFYWEYWHRNLGRLIGLVFFLPFMFFWVRGAFDKPLKNRLLIGLGLGGLQGAMGWFMVSSGLVDRVSVSHFRLAAHLFLAFFIFAYFLHLILSLISPVKNGKAYGLLAQPKLLYATASVFVLQIISGALVAGLRAGKVYPTFPKMGPDWLPASAFSMETFLDNFLYNPVLVQFTHRWLGITTAVLLLVWVGKSWSSQLSSAQLQKKRVLSMALAAAVVVQVLLGVTTLISGVSLSIALSHQLGALLTWGLFQSQVYFTPKPE